MMQTEKEVKALHKNIKANLALAIHHAGGSPNDKNRLLRVQEDYEALTAPLEEAEREEEAKRAAEEAAGQGALPLEPTKNDAGGAAADTTA